MEMWTEAVGRAGSEANRAPPEDKGNPCSEVSLTLWREETLTKPLEARESRLSVSGGRASRQGPRAVTAAGEGEQRWAECCLCDGPGARKLRGLNAQKLGVPEASCEQPSRGPGPPSDLLSWRDEGVDVLEHWLQGAVIAHAQVLDLDLPLVWPVLGDQRWGWGPGWGQPPGWATACVQGAPPRLPLRPSAQHTPPTATSPSSPS